jgi:hypothetical protein
MNHPAAGGLKPADIPGRFQEKHAALPDMGYDFIRHLTVIAVNHHKVYDSHNNN